MAKCLLQEIGRSTDGTAEETGRYRQMLVRTLHSATIKFPDVAANIVPVLMEFLSDDCEAAAQDVLVFVREAVQRLPHLRAVVLAQLQVNFRCMLRFHAKNSLKFCHRTSSAMGKVTHLRHGILDVNLNDPIFYSVNK